MKSDPNRHKTHACTHTHVLTCKRDFIQRRAAINTQKYTYNKRETNGPQYRAIKTKTKVDGNIQARTCMRLLLYGCCWQVKGIIKSKQNKTKKKRGRRRNGMQLHMAGVIKSLRRLIFMSFMMMSCCYHGYANTNAKKIANN